VLSLFAASISPAFATGVGFTNQTGGVLNLVNESSSATGYCVVGNVGKACSSSLSNGGQQWVEMKTPADWISFSYDVLQGANKIANIEVSINNPSGHPGGSVKVNWMPAGYSPKFAFSCTPSGVYNALCNITASNMPSSSDTDLLPQPEAYTQGILYRGVNLTGLEWGSSVSTVSPPDLSWLGPQTAGAEGFNGGVDNGFIEDGINTVRLPVKWSYLLNDAPTPNGTIDFSKGYAQTMDQMINNLTADGMYVVLDLHAYMRYCPGAAAGSCNNIIQSGQNLAGLVSTWSQLATRYQNNNHVIFDLMNEPNNMDASVVANNYIAVLKAIEPILNAGSAKNWVLLEGTGWSGAYAWVANQNDQYLNKTYFTNAGITYPNIAISPHQYFSLPNGGGGGSNTCAVNPNNVLSVENWITFENAAKASGFPIFFTEIGAGSDSSCDGVIQTYLQALASDAYDPVNNPTGVMGWIAWAVNPGLTDGTNLYPAAAHPVNFIQGFETGLTVESSTPETDITFVNALPSGSSYSLQLYDNNFANKATVENNIPGGSTPAPLKNIPVEPWTVSGIAVYDSSGNQYICIFDGNYLDLSTCVKSQ